MLGVGCLQESMQISEKVAVRRAEHTIARY